MIRARNVKRIYGAVLQKVTCKCSSGQGYAVFPVEPRDADTNFLEKKIYSSKYISANTKSAISSQRNERTLCGS